MAQLLGISAFGIYNVVHWNPDLSPVLLASVMRLRQGSSTPLALSDISMVYLLWILGPRFALVRKRQRFILGALFPCIFQVIICPSQQLLHAARFSSGHTCCIDMRSRFCFSANRLVLQIFSSQTTPPRSSST